MAWPRRREAETVDGRALVIPYDVQNSLDNESNSSANARVKSDMRLVVSSVERGQLRTGEQQRVTARLPNWVRIVLYYAGSNYGPCDHLPAEIHAPVRIDPATGSIVAVDVDQMADELAAYRDVAVQWWKENEAPLSDVRAALGAGEAAQAAKGLLGTWRGAVSGLRGENSAAPDAAEAEQRRRSANILKSSLERDPKQLSKVRASALQAAPLMVENVKSGTMSAAEFETWLQFQVTSGAVEPEEADEWRSAALE